MRLMDGAKLFIQVCRTHDKFIGLDELAELMDKTPTVEAIPIEWIKQYCGNKTIEDTMDCYWHFFEEDVLQMIDDWGKENGLLCD